MSDRFKGALWSFLGNKQNLCLVSVFLTKAYCVCPWGLTNTLNVEQCCCWTTMMNKHVMQCILFLVNNLQNQFFFLKILNCALFTFMFALLLNIATKKSGLHATAYHTRLETWSHGCWVRKFIHSEINCNIYCALIGTYMWTGRHTVRNDFELTEVTCIITFTILFSSFI